MARSHQESHDTTWQRPRDGRRSEPGIRQERERILVPENYLHDRHGHARIQESDSRFIIRRDPRCAKKQQRQDVVTIWLWPCRAPAAAHALACTAAPAGHGPLLPARSRGQAHVVCREIGLALARMRGARACARRHAMTAVGFCHALG